MTVSTVTVTDIVNEIIEEEEAAYDEMQEAAQNARLEKDLAIVAGLIPDWEAERDALSERRKMLGFVAENLVGLGTPASHTKFIEAQTLNVQIDRMEVKITKARLAEARARYDLAMWAPRPSLDMEVWTKRERVEALQQTLDQAQRDLSAAQEALDKEHERLDNLKAQIYMWAYRLDEARTSRATHQDLLDNALQQQAALAAKARGDASLESGAESIVP